MRLRTHPSSTSRTYSPQMTAEPAQEESRTFVPSVSRSVCDTAIRRGHRTPVAAWAANERGDGGAVSGRRGARGIRGWQPWRVGSPAARSTRGVLPEVRADARFACGLGAGVCVRGGRGGAVVVLARVSVGRPDRNGRARRRDLVRVDTSGSAALGIAPVRGKGRIDAGTYADGRCDR